jgi:hypothetical protein
MLIEAAQHLDKHPGPLGHFFRRLARKKNRNVAVVAGARKLAAIGWQMLVTNEPYRYAIPRSTETFLLSGPEEEPCQGLISERCVLK